MAGDRFQHGLDLLYGEASFNVGAQAAIIPAWVNTNSFRNCTVESVPQTRGRKPHLAVKDHDGRVVFEVGARSTGAHAVLSSLEGQSIKSFLWKETSSIYDDKTYLQCKIKAGRRELPDEDLIGRIVLDTETTGLNPGYDEILQLAIIDGQGNVLFNEYYKPDERTMWPEAQRIHHISPDLVVDESSIREDLHLIQNILDHAMQVCVYNAPFDLSFLGLLGLRLDKSKVVDTMRAYGRRFHRTSFYKLEKAARECGYRYSAHDALEDCRATLVVQQRVDRSKPLHERLSESSARTEEALQRVNDAVQRARVYDAAHSGSPRVDSPDEEQPTRQSETLAVSNAPEELPQRPASIKEAWVAARASASLEKESKRYSRGAYVLFVIVTVIVACVTALFVLSCFAIPAMAIVAIPMVLLTMLCIRTCKWTKSRLKPRRKRKH